MPISQKKYTERGSVLYPRSHRWLVTDWESQFRSSAEIWWESQQWPDFIAVSEDIPRQ